ncbi:MAG TPA: hypothetical protein VLI91_05895, partial [Roseiarcus sp.]|nr:hypothetical protein [Roseiarcus sp.]
MAEESIPRAPQSFDDLDCPAVAAPSGPKHMKLRNTAALGVVGLLLSGAGTGYAGTLTTVNDTNALDLANALTTGGAGGITITGETLSSN